MATSTTNFGLTKPAYSDTADISDINGNMEAIDTKLAEGVYYGTCSTAAGTQQKDVTAANFPAVLSAGMKLSVKFTNGQTFNGQPTLKVNSLTAKNICSFGTTAAAQYEWQAGEVIDFIYDGTQWVVVNGGIAGTTYYGKTKLTSDLTGTSEWLAATQKAVNTLNNKLSRVNTEEYRWYATTFSTTPAGSNYYASLPSMPVGKTCEFAVFNILGIGDVTGITGNLPNDGGQAYISTTNSNYAGKAVSVRIRIH